jgi:hypothetical protein
MLVVKQSDHWSNLRRRIELSYAGLMLKERITLTDVRNPVRKIESIVMLLHIHILPDRKIPHI